jgi:hypothetical protein
MIGGVHHKFGRLPRRMSNAGQKTWVFLPSAPYARRDRHRTQSCRNGSRTLDGPFRDRTPHHGCPNIRGRIVPASLPANLPDAERKRLLFERLYGEPATPNRDHEDSSRGSKNRLCSDRDCSPKRTVSERDATSGMADRNRSHLAIRETHPP